jgi:hypothetical protein
MANIPPRSFYKLNKEQQEEYAVKKMNELYALADQWKTLARDSRKKHIPDPDIDRPDLMNLKDPVN